MSDKEESLFLLTFVSGFTGRGPGEYIIGEASRSDYEAWCTEGIKLTLENPKTLIVIMQQAQDNPGYQTVSVSVLPLHFAGKSKQKFISLDPTWIEVLGEIEESDGGIKSCSENTELFNQYMAAIHEFNAERSGLHIPSRGDVFNLTKK